MTLRRAAPGDADAIAALERICFAVPWSRESILADLGNNPAAKYLLAEQDGEVAGYVGMWHVLDEGQITNLAVRPEHRRQGVATLLLGALLAEARAEKVARVMLEVRERNTGAIALYESMGFRRNGLRKGYYPDDGDNAVLMDIRLDLP